MLRIFCNGCGQPIESKQQAKRVQVTEATLPGPDQHPGLKPDRLVEGDLCPECVERIFAFIGEGKTFARTLEVAAAG